jgi:hypothetical protein
MYPFTQSLSINGIQGKGADAQTRFCTPIMNINIYRAAEREKEHK